LGLISLIAGFGEVFVGFLCFIERFLQEFRRLVESVPSAAAARRELFPVLLGTVFIAPFALADFLDLIGGDFDGLLCGSPPFFFRLFQAVEAFLIGLIFRLEHDSGSLHEE
jgi:hypothetical protein